MLRFIHLNLIQSGMEEVMRKEEPLKKFLAKRFHIYNFKAIDFAS